MYQDAQADERKQEIMAIEDSLGSLEQLVSNDVRMDIELTVVDCGRRLVLESQPLNVSQIPVFSNFIKAMELSATVYDMRTVEDSTGDVEYLVQFDARYHHHDRGSNGHTLFDRRTGKALRYVFANGRWHKQ